MMIRREVPADAGAIRAVHAAAFARDGSASPPEVALVDQLRECDGWIPELSLVAVDPGVVGHVVCTRAQVGDHPALGLGPLGVRPDRQRQGVGSALMHAVLGAADARDEPVVVLLGSRYYRRFGFVDAARLGIVPPTSEWASHFQARPLAAYDAAAVGVFRYAEPFERL
jgi:putative acetyltransferase